MDNTNRQHLPNVADVQQLTRQGSDQIIIGADTPVLCIHRGRRHTENSAPVRHPQASSNRQGWHEEYFVGDYKDTFDGNHYVVAPGYFTAPYGAALHFQKRAVVPGSRNPETQGQLSFIAIIGVVQPHAGGGFEVLKAVDDPQDWQPFSDEECDRYEIAFEAIDRDSMINPIDDKVVLAGVRPGPPAPRTNKPNIQTTDESILEPGSTDTNAAIRDQRTRGAAADDAGDDQGDAGDAGDAGDQGGRTAARQGRKR